MIKKHLNNKAFLEIKVYFSKMIQWSSFLPLLPRYSSTKNSPMLYSNLNGDKNYVI